YVTCRPIRFGACLHQHPSTFDCPFIHISYTDVCCCNVRKHSPCLASRFLQLPDVCQPPECQIEPFFIRFHHSHQFRGWNLAQYPKPSIFRQCPIVLFLFLSPFFPLF